MKNIFLVGMPSSGKSTLGKKLARALNYRFIDLDKMIIKEEKKSINQLFGENGEGYFREVESRLLKEIKPEHWLVIATGGGAPCFFDNMDFIKGNGLSIFLNIPASELAERISRHNKDDRPLLSGIEGLEQELESKHKIRFPYYSRADYIITEDTTVRQLVDLVKPII
jgi:shikimate kinase